MRSRPTVPAVSGHPRSPGASARMALRLTLKPHERVLIGSAVLTNGRHRTELSVENHVPVLRGTDIVSPTSVRTPCERIMLALQLAYVEPARRETHLASYHALVAEVLDAVPRCRPFLAPIDEALDENRWYAAIKLGRLLLQFERELLSHVS